ncbi:MAG TPA: PQQ-binding-like beta-propeller repeat protein [Terriglobia bacterium]|nr:PQQ-binding-like beta-propeller repeat protein [Terriglobia bacterium]
MSARLFRLFLISLPVFFPSTLLLGGQSPAGKTTHLLYVASPGIRNYVEYGGVGILVFDMDNGFKFAKRIPTWNVAPGEKPENVKGIAASAKTGRIYVTNNKRMLALDAVTGKILWDKAYEGGCDRLAISPDGKTLYVPQLEGNFWNVVNADTGAVITSIETDSGAHNTIYSLDGQRVYMAGLRSKLLTVADAQSRKVLGTVGPFSDVIRPFTVNGTNTLCFVNVNGLLGFEVGDIRTGRKRYRVEVQGYQQGPVKRHGCPSHGIALTPDEREIWVSDGANNAIHIFDATVMPPQQTDTIKLRDMPGWISFSMDGRYAFPSTGEVIDVATRKVVATLTDETGRAVQSEKLLDLTIAHGKVLRAGNQFGVGMKRE